MFVLFVEDYGLQTAIHFAKQARLKCRHLIRRIQAMQNEDGDWIVPAYLLENKQVMMSKASNETHAHTIKGHSR
jgi:hypothetical protein